MAPAHAAPSDKLTLHPSGFGQKTVAAWKAQQGETDSTGGANQALYLQKDAPTAELVAAVAVVKGLEGQTAGTALQGLEWQHRNDGRCDGGSPRWNIVTRGVDGSYHYSYLGCGNAAHSPGDQPGWTRDTFDGTAIATALGSNAAEPIAGLGIVFDEGPDTGIPFVYLDNIKVNDKTWTSPADNGSA